MPGCRDLCMESGAMGWRHGKSEKGFSRTTLNGLLDCVGQQAHSFATHFTPHTAVNLRGIARCGIEGILSRPSA